MLNVITIIVSKMTSHCGHGTNERRVRKRDKKVRKDVIKTTAEDGERGDSSDVRWKTVPQTNGVDNGCNRKTLCRRQWTDEYVERSNVQRR